MLVVKIIIWNLGLRGFVGNLWGYVFFRLFFWIVFSFAVTFTGGVRTLGFITINLLYPRLKINHEGHLHLHLNFHSNFHVNFYLVDQADLRNQ